MEFVFNNGTRKEVSPDGKSVTIFFFNGDYKKTSQDGSVVGTGAGELFHDM